MPACFIMKEFRLNLVLELRTKICRISLILVRVGEIQTLLHMRFKPKYTVLSERVRRYKMH